MSGREAPSIVRLHRNNNFTVVANETIRDTRLSFRARGILGWILSHSDGFKFTSLTITEAGVEGRDAVRTAMSELEKFGYLVRERIREGTRWKTILHVYEVPQEPDSQASGPAADSQASESQASSTKDQEQNQNDAGPDGPPCNEDPDELLENEPRTIAMKFYDWVVANDDGKKPAWKVPAMIKRVETAQREGFNRAQIKQGLATLHERGMTITDQTLRNAMTGRLPGQSRKQQQQKQGVNDDWISAVAAVHRDNERDSA